MGIISSGDHCHGVLSMGFFISGNISKMQWRYSGIKLNKVDCVISDPSHSVS